MATRPVFVPKDTAPFVEEINCDFNWHANTTLKAHRANIKEIHDAFHARYPDLKILETSSKAEVEIGRALGSRELMKFVPSLGKKVPFECVYQGGKIFLDGTYSEIYTMKPNKAKAYLEMVVPYEKPRGFEFEGKVYPLVPESGFYDWLYINAILDNPELIPQLLEYDVFTDFTFVPGKSVVCQGRAVAVFVSLYKLNLLDSVKDFDSFVDLVYSV